MAPKRSYSLHSMEQGSRPRRFESPRTHPCPYPRTGKPDFAELRARLRAVQGGAAAAQSIDFVPSGVPALDARLPGGGVPAGAVTELLFEREGAGATSLAVRLARAAARAGGHVVWVEPAGGDVLYPPALVQAGLDPARLIVVRPTRWADCIWACEQSLRCTGVAAVVFRHRRLQRADPRVFRVLQLAAERGGGLGIALRPATIQREAAGDGVNGAPPVTFAAVQLLVRPIAPTAAEARGSPAYRLWILKTREGRPAETITVDWCDEAGDGVVSPVPGDRARDSSKRLASA
jgi:protein ImuA